MNELYSMKLKVMFKFLSVQLKRSFTLFKFRKSSGIYFSFTRVQLWEMYTKSCPLSIRILFLSKNTMYEEFMRSILAKKKKKLKRTDINRDDNFPLNYHKKNGFYILVVRLLLMCTG